ncbi:hypothetical protein FP742_07800 [Vibrio parahaemolyticus]|uniref:Uncharacterized protein n=2 Tax=Vibrio parahaemolyticus TaxID=670 RepID=A0AA46QW78_VIBPH|nr:hypothetical protein RK51_023200 [Vibrio parahaemolyticus]QGG35130.1 hypothetical protein GH799_18715 [Vibrio parahaemolyticus 10329]BAC61480.1 hypothetical protein [Vibrio parahaemolyticus RIMD 2210633]AVJ53931.1 hypothetical protein A6J30_25565 [Vibrio parahaemolyticus]AZV74153.1 hypothetical protein D0853_24755 [Vibrio parahaemolyticus]
MPKETTILYLIFQFLLFHQSVALENSAQQSIKKLTLSLTSHN